MYCTVAEDAIYYAKISLRAQSSDLQFTRLPWPSTTPPEKVLLGGVFPDVSTIFFYLSVEGQVLYNNVFLRQQQLDASSPSLDESSSEIKYVKDSTNGIVHFFDVVSGGFEELAKQQQFEDADHYLHLFPYPGTRFRYGLLQRHPESKGTFDTNHSKLAQHAWFPPFSPSRLPHGNQKGRRSHRGDIV